MDAYTSKLERENSILIERLSTASDLASDRLDLLDRIRRVAKSRCLRDSDKVAAINQILKGF